MAVLDRINSPEDIKKLKMGIVGSLPEDKDDSKYGMSIWKNLFRHEIIKKNGIVFQSEREMLSEDALFMVDYIACIERATGIPEAFYNYRRNENSISKGTIILATVNLFGVFILQVLLTNHILYSR